MFAHFRQRCHLSFARDKISQDCEEQHAPSGGGHRRVDKREQSDHGHETGAQRKPRDKICHGSGECIRLVELFGFLKDVDAQGVGKVIGECGNEEGTQDNWFRRVRRAETANQGHAGDNRSCSSVTNSARLEHSNWLREL